MALQYFCDIDLTLNEIQNVSLQKLGANPTAANSVTGMIIFRTDQSQPYICTNGAAGTWVAIGTGQGVESITSGDGTASTGAAITANAAATGAVTINAFKYAGGSNIGYVPEGGSVGEYLNGEGDWVDANTGDVTKVIPSVVNAAKGISVISQSGPIPVVGLDIIGQTNIGATPANDDELIIYDLSTLTNKSITVANLMSATTPANDSTITLNGGAGLANAGGAFTLNQAANETITFTVGEGAGITVNANDVAVSYSGADSVVRAAADGTSNTLVDNDTVLIGDNGNANVYYSRLSQLKTYINAGNFNNFIISDGTTSQTIDDGETVTFTKVDTSTKGLINLTVSATNTVTANAITGAAGVATALTLVDRDGSGNIWVTTVNGELNGTITTGTTGVTQTFGNSTTRLATTAFVQAAVAPKLEDWTIAGDTGSSVVADGQTVKVAGSVGIDTAESSRVVTVNLDLNELSTSTSYDSGSDYVVIVDGGTNAKILSTNIPLNDWGAADGTIDAGSQLISNVLDPVGQQDAATKEYVDAATTGLLQFMGGFRADTGQITSGPNYTAGAGNETYIFGSSRVAIAVGDYYVASGTQSGNFYGDAAYPLTPGDSVIATVARAANASVVGDWSVVQSDTDLATAGANAGAATLGISSYSSADFSVTTGFVTISDVTLGTQTSGNYAASIAASSDNDKLGIYVNPSAGESVNYTVGLDIDSLVDLGVPVNTDTLAIYDASAGVNRKVTVVNLASQVIDAGSYAATVTLVANTALTVTHGLGTFDVMVQLYDATTYQTVYAEIDRTGSNTITVKACTAPPNNIRVLVQKIIA
jgi:hypothetical protein